MYITAKQPIQFYDLDEKKGVTSTLKKIKKFLTKKRWIQGSYNAGDNYCLIGAANHIDGPLEEEVVRLMHFEAETHGYSSTEDFNDESRRRYEHITSFLNNCINRVEKGRVISE